MLIPAYKSDYAYYQLISSKSGNQLSLLEI